MKLMVKTVQGAVKYVEVEKTDKVRNQQEEYECDNEAHTHFVYVCVCARVGELLPGARASEARNARGPSETART